MSLSIGTLVGYLQLDDSNFNRKADNADRKLSALKLHLEALKRSNPKISVEVDAQTAKIDELKVKIEALKAQAAEGVDVRVDMVQTLLDMDRLQMKVRELDRSEAKIRVKVDDQEALSRLDRLQAKVSGTTMGFGALATSAIALGPALVPITGALGGLVAALGAPIAAVGGGLGLYGLITGHAIKDTEAQATAIAALKKQMDAAKVSMASATTASGRKSAMAMLAKDTALYNAALAKLNPAQAKFLKSQMALKGAFTKLEAAAGPAIFGPLTSVMDLAAKLLPKTAPVLNAVASALSGIITSLSNSGVFNSFLGFLTKASGPAITGFATFLGNIAQGLVSIVEAFSGQGASVTRSIGEWAAGFAKIGQSKGLADFVAYVHQVGPQVAATLGAVATAIGHIVVAIAPVGSVSLAGIKLLADIINSIPPPLLSAIASGFVAASLGAKLFAGSMALVSAAMDANPIGLAALAVVALGVAFTVLYQKSAWFRTYFPLVLGAFAGPLGLVFGLFGKLIQHFDAVESAALGMARVVVGAVKGIADVWLAVVGALIDGAAKAFGWVPGIGGKLKAAAAQFDQFRNQVNAALNGVISHLTTHYGFTGQSAALAAIRQIKAEMASIPKSVQTQYYVNQVNRLGKGPVTGPGSHAAGGFISGPGTGTSDSIPARLSNGEFVMNAAATRRLLPWLQAENAKGYATGGYVRHPAAPPVLTVKQAAGAASSLDAAILSALGLTKVGGPLSQVRQALSSYAATIRMDNGHLGTGFAELTRDILSLSKATLSHQKALAKDQATLASLQQAQSALASAVTSQFTGSTFNAGQARNLATGQQYVSDLSAQENTMMVNKATASATLTYLKSLKGLGISKAAFTQLAQSGDVGLLGDLVSGGKSEVAHYNALLAAQNSSAAAVGKYAGVTAYGAPITAEQKTIASLDASIKTLNTELRSLRQELPHGMQKAVHAGSATGVQAGLKSTSIQAQHGNRNIPKGP